MSIKSIFFKNKNYYNILNYYPIGTVYISTSDFFNPNVSFGGNWQRIDGSNALSCLFGSSGQNDSALGTFKVGTLLNDGEFSNDYIFLAQTFIHSHTANHSHGAAAHNHHAPGNGDWKYLVASGAVAKFVKQTTSYLPSGTSNYFPHTSTGFSISNSTTTGGSTNTYSSNSNSYTGDAGSVSSQKIPIGFSRYGVRIWVRRS